MEWILWLILAFILIPLTLGVILAIGFFGAYIIEKEINDKQK